MVEILFLADFPLNANKGADLHILSDSGLSESGLIESGERVAKRVCVLALFAVLVFSSGFEFAHAETVGDEARRSLGGSWDKSHYSRARLFGVRLAGKNGEQVFAAVEIELDEHWKTYWRQPGSAGGVPPRFNWSDSGNVVSAEVLYPAPQRFRDFAGSTIGYKNRVVFPVRIAAVRAGEPVELKLSLRYGICSSICVPVHAMLSYNIGPDRVTVLPSKLKRALSRVPREGDAVIDSDPRLEGYRIDVDGERPRLVMDVDFAGQPGGGEVFVEANGGVFLPMAVRRPKLGPAAFAVDLTHVGGAGAIKGRALTVTIVGNGGHSASQIHID